MSFCFECAAEGERHFEPTDAMLPQGVRSALDATRDVRKRYVQTTPPTDLRADDAGLHTAYMSEVHPNLTHTSWPPPRREQAVRLSAWQAFRLAAEEILPVAQSLYVTDTNRLARHLQRNPEAAQRARAQLGRGGAWSELEGALRRGATDNQGERPAGEAARELAQALLDDALGGRAHRPLIASDAGVFTREDMKAGTPAATAMPVLRLPESTAPYDVAYRQVAAQVEDLVRHLDEVLRPRKRLTRRSGYASGQRLDLRRVMAWEADPKQWNRIWSRTTIPERREVAVGLLVDLSGSMSGAPARHALLGTVLLAETLHRLQVPFAIDGFQDVLIPFHDFDDPLDAHVRQRIAEMPKEVDGSRQGGHNSPGHNDDGPCLMEFAEKVSGQAATDRVLLVLSDGEPAGRRSNSQDLRNAVRVLSEPAAGLRLIGLGLGPGTEHVRSFYPEHEANVPLEELASRIGALLERVLIG
ncbi:MAG: hypothetical protein KC502_14890 [Myxococcales bacterium]|nr:hypothetical protein [Myxococcales bacterium]